MLDQNTDRMWFVIGAVIVGAAIIFIANGTLPDIFASVTESFESSSNQALDVVDKIGVKNQVRNGNFSDGLAHWEVNGKADVVEVDGQPALRIGVADNPVSGGGGVHQANILDESSSVRITFEAKGISNRAWALVGFLNTQNQNKTTVLTKKWQTYTIDQTDIDISRGGHNRLHIYSQNTEFYIRNVRAVLID